MATPNIHITVSVDFRIQNGITVALNENDVTISQPGPNGGRGNVVTIRLGDWEALDSAVTKVRNAVMRANEAVKDELTDPEPPAPVFDPLAVTGAAK